MDAWTAACATGDNTYLNVPAGKSYQIWPVTLAGPCQGEIKLLVHPSYHHSFLFLSSVMSHPKFSSISSLA